MGQVESHNHNQTKPTHIDHLTLILKNVLDIKVANHVILYEIM